MPPLRSVMRCCRRIRQSKGRLKLQRNAKLKRSRSSSVKLKAPADRPKQKTNLLLMRKKHAFSSIRKNRQRKVCHHCNTTSESDIGMGTELTQMKSLRRNG